MDVRAHLKPSLGMESKVSVTLEKPVFTIWELNISMVLTGDLYFSLGVCVRFIHPFIALVEILSEGYELNP